MTTRSWPAPPPRDARPYDVVGLGECSADHLLVMAGDYPAEDSKHPLQRYELAGGGQIATALVGCARLGLRTLYLGAVGDDEIGQWVIADLGVERVGTDRVVRVPGTPTRSAFIVVAGAGSPAGASRTILFQRDPRLDVPAAAFGEAPGLGRVLHLDATVPEASLAGARLGRHAGAVVTLDIDHVYPGMEALLEACDLVIASSGFARELGQRPSGVQVRPDTLDELEAGLRELGRLTAGFVACTAGAAGSLALLEGKVHLEPGFAVEVVDTTGAGDIYHAGFIHGFLQGLAPPQAMRFANAAAALKCQRLGGRPGAPRPDEVAALLASRP